MAGSNVLNISDILESEVDCFAFSDASSMFVNEDRSFNQQIGSGTLFKFGIATGEDPWSSLLSSENSNEPEMINGRRCDSKLEFDSDLKIKPENFNVETESINNSQKASSSEKEDEYLKELADLIQDAISRPDENFSQNVDKTPMLRNLIYQLKQRSKERQENPVQHEDVSSSGPTLLASQIGSKILEYLDGFFFVMNTDGFVEYISRNVVKYLKFEQSQMVNKPIYNFIHTTDHEHFSALLPDTLSWSMLGLNNDSINIFPTLSQHHVVPNLHKRSHHFVCRFLTNKSTAVEFSNDRPASPSTASTNFSDCERLQVIALKLPLSSTQNSTNLGPFDSFFSTDINTFDVMTDSQPCLVCIAKRLPDAIEPSALTGCQFSVLCSKNGSVSSVIHRSGQSSFILPRDFSTGSSIHNICHPQDLRLLNCIFQEPESIKSPIRLRILCCATNSFVPVQVQWFKKSSGQICGLTTANSDPLPFNPNFLESYTDRCGPYIQLDFTILQALDLSTISNLNNPSVSTSSTSNTFSLNTHDANSSHAFAYPNSDYGSTMINSSESSANFKDSSFKSSETFGDVDCSKFGQTSEHPNVDNKRRLSSTSKLVANDHQSPTVSRDCASATGVLFPVQPLGSVNDQQNTKGNKARCSSALSEPVSTPCFAPQTKHNNFGQLHQLGTSKISTPLTFPQTVDIQSVPFFAASTDGQFQNNSVVVYDQWPSINDVNPSFDRCGPPTCAGESHQIPFPKLSRSENLQPFCHAYSSTNRVNNFSLPMSHDSVSSQFADHQTGCPPSDHESMSFFSAVDQQHSSEHRFLTNNRQIIEIFTSNSQTLPSTTSVVVQSSVDPMPSTSTSSSFPVSQPRRKGAKTSTTNRTTVTQRKNSKKASMANSASSISEHKIPQILESLLSKPEEQPVSLIHQPNVGAFGISSSMYWPEITDHGQSVVYNNNNQQNSMTGWNMFVNNNDNNNNNNNNNSGTNETMTSTSAYALNSLLQEENAKQQQQHNGTSTIKSVTKTTRQTKTAGRGKRKGTSTSLGPTPGCLVGNKQRDVVVENFLPNQSSQPTNQIGTICQSKQDSLLVQLLERPLAPQVSQTRSLPTSIANTQYDQIGRDNKENPERQPTISTLVVESLLNNKGVKNSSNGNDVQQRNCQQQQDRLATQQMMTRHYLNTRSGQVLTSPVVTSSYQQPSSDVIDNNNSINHASIGFNFENFCRSMPSTLHLNAENTANQFVNISPPVSFSSIITPSALTRPSTTTKTATVFATKQQSTCTQKRGRYNKAGSGNVRKSTSQANQQANYSTTLNHQASTLQNPLPIPQLVSPYQQTSNQHMVVYQHQTSCDQIRQPMMTHPNSAESISPSFTAGFSRPPLASQQKLVNTYRSKNVQLPMNAFPYVSTPNSFLVNQFQTSSQVSYFAPRGAAHAADVVAYTNAAYPSPVANVADVNQSCNSNVNVVQRHMTQQLACNVDKRQSTSLLKPIVTSEYSFVIPTDHASSSSSYSTVLSNNQQQQQQSYFFDQQLPQSTPMQHEQHQQSVVGGAMIMRMNQQSQPQPQTHLHLNNQAFMQQTVQNVTNGCNIGDEWFNVDTHLEGAPEIDAEATQNLLKMLKES